MVLDGPMVAFGAVMKPQSGVRLTDEQCASLTFYLSDGRTT